MIMSTEIKRILIEQEVAEHPSVRRIVSQFNTLEFQYIDTLDSRTLKNENDYKNTLVLAKQRGKFVSKCPGTMGHICCNYYVVHNGMNCIYDCTYCFLKFYNNNPFLCIYVNKEDLFKEIDELQASGHVRHIRIGTGEFTDSLALDHITQESMDIIPYFLKNPLIFVELKTKSNNIENLRRFKPTAGNIVIGWSVNTEKVIQGEEHYASNLEARLQAASECAKMGYKIAFHFDPIIHYENWENEYREVVDKIFQYVSPDKISWISLGTLRYHKSLKNEIISKFPESTIIYNETIYGKDDKVRYFKPIRVKIYRTLRSHIMKYSKDVPLYLCMELPDVWEKVFGYCPDYTNKHDILFAR